MRRKTIQWNWRGLKTNINDLLLLITQECPSIICLQETFLIHCDNINIRNYEMFNYTRDSGGRASGGVLVLIRKDIPHSKINITTNIQAVAIKATLHKAIYIPPSDDIDKNELKKLIDQLPRPFILLGDFNSHNTLWGCKDTNKKGRMLEKVINENDTCLLNNGAFTYVNRSSGNHSAVNLSLCDSTAHMDFTWNGYDDTGGSDHFPILIQSPEASSEKTPRWKLDKADWQIFTEKC